MKKLLLRILSAWYSYYNSGSDKDIAYESAIIANTFPLVFVFYIVVAAFYNFCTGGDFDEVIKNKHEKYIHFALLILISFMLIRKIFPKKVILSVGYHNKKLVFISFMFYIIIMFGAFWVVEII